jgi:hypothetical protein
VNSTALRVDTHAELGFCSEHCRSRFLADPERYVAAAVADETLPTLPRITEASGAIHLSVDGMTCASCVSTVESALNAVPGVIDTRRRTTILGSLDASPRCGPGPDRWRIHLEFRRDRRPPPDGRLAGGQRPP